MTGERIRLVGIPIDDLSFEEALDRMEEMIQKRRPAGQALTLNVDVMVKLRRDPQFRAVAERSPLVLADGMPILWAVRFLGRPIRARICGTDLVPALSRRAAEKGYSVYFFGGKPGAAEEAAFRLGKRYPGLRVAGISVPPFGFEADPSQNARFIQEVKRAAPNILFVALGAPRQEKWLDAHLAELGIPLCLGVGGTFEIVAGLRARAPVWLQWIGLEWVWRLLQEPARLWRRYLVENPVFFWWVLLEKLGRKGLNR